jgi:choline monooxygenase
MDDCGRTSVLQCKYHGWTYLLDGSLRGVPKFDRAELFDRKDYGLVPIDVSTWQGLLFVSLADDPGPLANVLDGITERIAPIQLDALRFVQRDTYEVACNWKVYVDNYLEGYHVPLVHPELCDVLSVRDYVTETYAHYSLQHSPLKASASDSPYETDGAAFYYFVFPNIMLNILPGRLQMNAVIPLAPGRTRVMFDYFYGTTDTIEAQQRVERDVAFSDRVQQEDIEICEHVQRGLRSKAYDRGRFSVEMEEGVYHFQRLLKRAYRAALP